MGKSIFMEQKKAIKVMPLKNIPKYHCVLDKGVKHGDDWWYTFKSVIVFGKINIIQDKDEKIDKLTHFGNKFIPTPEETESEIRKLLDRTEVFEITIEHMSGKIVEEK